MAAAEQDKQQQQLKDKRPSPTAFVARSASDAWSTKLQRGSTMEITQAETQKPNPCTSIIKDLLPSFSTVQMVFDNPTENYRKADHRGQPEPEPRISDHQPQPTGLAHLNTVPTSTSEARDNATTLSAPDIPPGFKFSAQKLSSPPPTSTPRCNRQQKSPISQSKSNSRQRQSYALMTY